MWKRWFRRQRDNTAGVTLVELVVTFALLGIFMTAVSLMMSSSLRLFTRMQATARAVTVSDVLLDKVAGEIAAAREPEMDSNYDASQGYYFWLESDAASPWVTMWNRSGSPLAIYAEPDPAGGSGNVLCLKYYETVRGDDYEAEHATRVPEVDWHFDESVYMGYRITDGGLTFTREDAAAHPNVIRIDLEITNTRTGFTYRTFRYAESYNYEFPTDKVRKYMGVRNDSDADTPVRPVTAEEFMIDGELSGGGEGGDSGGDGGGTGGTDEGDPDENPLPDGWIRLTIIHKVIPYDGVYSESILKTEIVQKEYNQYDPWLPAEPMYPNELPEYTFDVGYQQVRFAPGEKEKTFTFHYTPKRVPYSVTAYDKNTGQRIQESEKEWGLHGELVTAEAPSIAGYELLGESSQTRPLRYTDANQNYVIDGPNEFRFEYRFDQQGNSVPYIIYYKWGEILLGQETGEGTYGTSREVTPKTFSGYTPLQWHQWLRFDNKEGCELVFEYRPSLSLSWSAPYRPVGGSITVEPETQRTALDQQIALEIFHFFNKGWQRIDVNHPVRKYGAYKLLDGTEYVIGGWIAADSGVNDNDLYEYLPADVDRDKVLFIKNNSISSERDREIFMDYMFEKIGKREEIKNIKFSFDKNYNLSTISYRREDGQTITITYKND